MLLHDVYDEEGIRQLGHISDRAEGELKLSTLTRDLKLLTLGEVIKGTISSHLIDLGHLLDGLADRSEVGEHTTGPALRDVRHTYCLSQLSDSALELLLRSYEEDLLASLCQALGDFCCFVDLNNSLVKVDDVDVVTLHEDVWSHSCIPLTGEVTKVGTCFYELVK